MEVTTSEFPIITSKHLVMKLDSALHDIHEMRAADGLSEDDKNQLSKIADMLYVSEAIVANMVARACNDENLLNEEVEMDEIDPWPEYDDYDLYDMTL